MKRFTAPLAGAAMACALAGPSMAQNAIIGFDSGPKSAQATPANFSHAAGVSVGGLFAVPIARIPGGSGIVSNFNIKSAGGFTGSGYLVRVWSRNPTNTMCTDNSNFAGSSADDLFLVTAPFTLVPLAPATTTGDSATYASLPNQTWDYATSGNQNIYVCLVANSTDTADQNAVVTVLASGPQN